MLKIKTFLFILLLALVAFIPAGKVGATTAQVYVGIQVTAATAPGTSGLAADNAWCLPIGTTLGVYGASCTVSGSGTGETGTCNQQTAVTNSGTTSVTTSTVPACSGGITLWSGLLSLSTGSNYVIQLYTPNNCAGGAFSGSYYYNCWIPNLVVGGVNQDCTTTCANYNLAPTNSTCNNENGLTTSNIGAIMDGLKALGTGSPCASYSPVSSTSYMYYDNTSGICYYPSAYGPPTIGCGAVASGLTRLCPCTYTSGSTNTFYFQYNPTSF